MGSQCNKLNTVPRMLASDARIRMTDHSTPPSHPRSLLVHQLVNVRASDQWGWNEKESP